VPIRGREIFDIRDPLQAGQSPTRYSRFRGTRDQFAEVPWPHRFHGATGPAVGNWQRWLESTGRLRKIRRLLTSRALGLPGLGRSEGRRWNKQASSEKTKHSKASVPIRAARDPRLQIYETPCEPRNNPPRCSRYRGTSVPIRGREIFDIPDPLQAAQSPTRYYRFRGTRDQFAEEPRASDIRDSIRAAQTPPRGPSFRGTGTRSCLNIISRISVASTPNHASFAMTETRMVPRGAP
jgi:hypothetical protein